MARLRKSDAEVLLAALDSELLVDALSAALRRVLEVEAYDGDWGALVRVAAEVGRWDHERQWQVLEGNRVALEDLAVELNERREL